MKYLSTRWLTHVVVFVGFTAWSNVMSILDEKEGGDSELLVYAMTLVNKVCAH